MISQHHYRQSGLAWRDSRNLFVLCLIQVPSWIEEVKINILFESVFYWPHSDWCSLLLLLLYRLSWSLDLVKGERIESPTIIKQWWLCFVIFVFFSLFITHPTTNSLKVLVITSTNKKMFLKQHLLEEAGHLDSRWNHHPRVLRD